MNNPQEPPTSIGMLLGLVTIFWLGFVINMALHCTIENFMMAVLISIVEVLITYAYVLFKKLK